MLDEFAWGRKDAKNVNECGTPMTSIPTGNKYVEHLTAMGMSEEEIVALASIESFAVLQRPDHSRWSSHPKFETYYYKELLTSTSDVELPHKGLLLNTPALRLHAEKFAESKEDYDTSLKSGLVKLFDYGHEDLYDIESFLLDDPDFKLRFPEHVVEGFA